MTPLPRHSADHIEQDGVEIRASVTAVLHQLRQETGFSIVRAGVATQRSSVIAWDRLTGQPLSPVLS
jgi:glycerol kinase